jgi:hypothetical protein
MTAVAALPLVEAAGEPYDLGFEHGRARAEALHAFFDDGLLRLDRLLPQPVPLESLVPTIRAYDEAITSATPRLSEEIGGLAEGAGLSRDQAVLLQIRREVMGYQRVPTRGDCTTYARAGERPVMAQTVDLNGDLDDQIAVLRLSPAGTGRQVLAVSFGGLLGYLGVNSDGLAVGLNLVLGGEWRPGLPPYLAIRHLLDSCGDVSEAIEVLARLPLASSRSLTLCDRDRTAWVEIVGDEQRVVESAESTHTNHLLHPDFVAFDELNIFARNSSAQRLEACRARLADLPATDDDPERHFALLGTPPIHVADSGDIRRERTVATAVAVPARTELHVRTAAGSRSARLEPAVEAVS